MIRCALWVLFALLQQTAVIWIPSLLIVTISTGIAQIFPMSSIVQYFDKAYPYYVTHSLETAGHDTVPVTLMPYSNSSVSTDPLNNGTLVLQTTKTTILSNFSNNPLNITSESFVTFWNDSSNFKTEENTLITSSSNDQPVTIAEPWTRQYKDVFGNYGLKPPPKFQKKSSQKKKVIKSKYDPVAYVYPPFSHPHAHPAPPHQQHPSPHASLLHPPHSQLLPPHPSHPPLIPHPSHPPPPPNEYVFIKPYDTSAEVHNLNQLGPPSNEVNYEYYVTSSSPYEEPDVSYYPVGEIMHTKKHHSKNMPRPPVTPLTAPSHVSHAHHPYPFYNQQVYLKPTPSYPPVKKFIATVRPIYVSSPTPSHTHTTHIIKYTTPSNPRYRVVPTLVDPIAQSLPPMIEHPALGIGATRTTAAPHITDILVPPGPYYHHPDYHNPYSTLGPYQLGGLKYDRNLLKQFNKFLNKEKKKKNEARDEDKKKSKEDYEIDEYDERDYKEDDDNEEQDDEEVPRKRKLKKPKNKHKNNIIEESRIESYRTRPSQKYKPKIKKNVKEPYMYFDKHLRDGNPAIPKNHKIEQNIDYGGSWEKKGMSDETSDLSNQYDAFRTQESNRVDVKHDLQADPQEQTEAMVQNADGQRVEFQMHGQGGAESYKFGYDTGAGSNRQFRYEERDGEGRVKGHYGYYNDDGKLQVFNYAAHPEHGFQAEQTNANFEGNDVHIEK